jgi:hypothetical protein
VPDVSPADEPCIPQYAAARCRWQMTSHCVHLQVILSTRSEYFSALLQLSDDAPLQTRSAGQRQHDDQLQQLQLHGVTAGACLAKVACSVFGGLALSLLNHWLA